MNDELVTIRTFFYDHETLLYGSRLEAEGIYYFLKDQKTITIDPFLSSAMGGIKLQVRYADAELALAIISELDAQHLETENPEVLYLGRKTYEKILEECPQCESEEVYKEKLNFGQSFLQLFSMKKYYCQACDYHWMQRYDD